MKIKVQGSELNRMMKTITQCIDTKHQIMGNICVIYDNNLLTIRGTNGQFAAVMSTPVLGGTGESFCVDGTMFARVCSMCNGEVSIETDAKTCTIRGAGRTRLPIVNVNVPNYERVTGDSFDIGASDFSKAYGGVAYAVSQDQTRITLTGILIETESEDSIRFVSIDGFRMAVENIKGRFSETGMVVPAQFMKLISASTFTGDVIAITTNGKKIQAETDGMLMSCTLLTGEFPPYDKIMPTEFKTEVLVNADLFRTALKSSGVVCSTSNLVKLEISEDKLTVSGNSEQADYEAEIPCTLQGNGLKIAFNLKYLLDTINSVSNDSIVLQFNLPTSPCVLHGKDDTGLRLILPVRVQG